MILRLYDLLYQQLFVDATSSWVYCENIYHVENLFWFGQDTKKKVFIMVILKWFIQRPS